MGALLSCTSPSLPAIDTQYTASNGYAYITRNVQHPGAEEDLNADRKDHPELFLGLRKLIDERCLVGYFSGLPAMKR